MPYLTTGLKLDVDIDAIRIANSLANGASIVELSNSVSGENEGVQATSGSRAVLATNEAPAGQAAAYFDNKNYSFGNILSGFTEGSIYLLIKKDVDPSGSEEGGLWTSAVSNTHYNFEDGDIYEAWGTDTRLLVGNPVASLASDYRLYTVISKAGEFKVYLDGTLLNSRGTNTPAFPSEFIFGHSNFTTFYLKGKILRMRAFNVAHTGIEVLSEKAEYAAEYELTNLGYVGDATYTLTAANGSFALTGQDAGLIKSWLLTASAVGFVLTGNAANLVYGYTYTLTATSGSFVLTGSNTTFTLGAVLIAPVESLIEFDEIEIDRNFLERIGISGGATFATAILGHPLGTQQRSSERLIPLHRFQFGYLKTPEDIAYLNNFFMTRRGQAIAFRLFPPFDYSWDDEEIALTDPDEDTYKLIRTYTYGTRTVTRRILKPVPSITVNIDGDPASDYSDYEVNYATGEIVFDTPEDLPDGGSLTVTGEYTIPGWLTTDEYNAQTHTFHQEISFGFIEALPTAFGFD